MKKPKVELFYCTAEQYGGDKPHFWHVVDGREVNWIPEGMKPRVASTFHKLCREHQTPVFLAPSKLVTGLKFDGYKMAEGVYTTYEWNAKKRANVPVIQKAFNMEGDGVTIQIIFYMPSEPKKRFSYESIGIGHTTFTTAKGTRTFDRTGVEDSFYVHLYDGVAGVQAKIEGQLKRVGESRERIKGMIDIPGINWLTTPEGKEEITKKLKAGKCHEFRPSGFGTGNVLYHRSRPARTWDKRAAP
jgi:hypothetical protein